MNKEVKYVPKIIDKRNPKEINIFISEEKALNYGYPVFKPFESNIVPKTKKLTNKKEHFWDNNEKYNEK